MVQIEKKEKHSPGPANYSPTEKGCPSPTSPSCRMNKTQNDGFMNDTQYLAERVPGAGKYDPKFPNLKRRSPTWTWSKTKKEGKKPKDKDVVGPGRYDDCQSYLKTTQSNPRRSVMTKDKGRELVIQN